MTTAVQIGTVLGYPAWQFQRSHTRNLVWTGTNTAYAFFKDRGLGNLAYAKTTDGGATWSAPVQVLPGSNQTFDIYFSKWTSTGNSATIHVVSHDDQGYHLFYNRLDTSTDTLAYAGATGQIITSFGAFPTSGAVSISLARNNDLLVTFWAGSYYSTDNGASWTAIATQFGQAHRDQITLWPDYSSGDTADQIAIWVDFTAAALKCVQWDKSGLVWGSPVTIATGVSTNGGDVGGYLDCTSALKRSTGHIFVAIWQYASSAANNLLTWDVYGTGSVTQKTNVVSNTTYAQACGIAIQPGGDVYCYYARDPNGLAFESSMQVYYRISTDSMATWGAEVAWSTAPPNTIKVCVVDPAPVLAATKISSAYQFGYEDSPSSYTWILWFEVATGEGSGGGGGGTGSPPIILKCKALDGVSVINPTALDSQTYGGNGNMSATTATVIETRDSVVVGGTYEFRTVIKRNGAVYSVAGKTIKATIRCALFPRLVLATTFEDMTVTAGNSDDVAAVGGITFNFSPDSTWPTPREAEDTYPFLVQLYVQEDDYYPQAARIHARMALD